MYYFLGVVLDLDEYIFHIHFPLADMFYLEGCLRLESSCIQVNTVSATVNIHTD